MTNEELVTRVQQGDTKLIPLLWEQVSRFIDMQAGKYLDNFPDHYRALRGDMVNESYTYFLMAIEKYDPERGSFLACLGWYIRGAFEAVAYNGRGNRQKNDPLNQAVSLDIPIDDTEDLMLTDMLADETAEVPYRELEDIALWQSVRKLLYEAIDHAADKVGSSLVRYMFDNDCNIGAASKALYGDKPVQYERYRKAMRQIRSYIGYSQVKKQMKDMGLDYIYECGTSLTAYKNHIFTSSVELAAMKRERLQLQP